MRSLRQRGAIDVWLSEEGYPCGMRKNEFMMGLVLRVTTDFCNSYVP